MSKIHLHIKHYIVSIVKYVLKQTLMGVNDEGSLDSLDTSYDAIAYELAHYWLLQSQVTSDSNLCRSYNFPLKKDFLLVSHCCTRALNSMDFSVD